MSKITQPVMIDAEDKKDAVQLGINISEACREGLKRKIEELKGIKPLPNNCTLCHEPMLKGQMISFKDMAQTKIIHGNHNDCGLWKFIKKKDVKA